MTKGRSGKRNAYEKESNAIDNFVQIHMEEINQYRLLKEIAFSKCGRYTPQEIKQARRSLMAYRYDSVEVRKYENKCIANTIPTSKAFK